MPYIQSIGSIETIGARVKTICREFFHVLLIVRQFYALSNGWMLRIRPIY